MKTTSKASLLIITLLFFVTAKAQIINDSLFIDGHYRSFHFNKPSANNTNTSLIFVLHGSGGNGIQTMRGATKLMALAEREHLLIVFPDGYKDNWNECRKMAPAAANVQNIDENTFFSKMIDYCEANYKINSARVFVVGTSGGGHMAYTLAMTMPEKIKAITAIIANIPVPDNMDCIEKKMPMPVLIINGTNDPTNPYNGGISAKNKGLVRSADESFRYWATLDGYKGEPTMEALPDTDPKDGKTIEKYTYKQKGKPEVTLLKVINGEHNFPNDIDVYLESWNFFKRQIEIK
ncbi:alpha/beta hydrolase family esterase [Flavobacterium sp.]|jgi:polyhydroxybutyrate depolymerase|uniref:alpha/beta hydrolase family esterase n=1 Tax=Flavobacterium sp. TaxID=239 RepID=UPI0037C0DC42